MKAAVQTANDEDIAFFAILIVHYVKNNFFVTKMTVVMK